MVGTRDTPLYFPPGIWRYKTSVSRKPIANKRSLSGVRTVTGLGRSQPRLTWPNPNLHRLPDR